MESKTLESAQEYDPEFNDVRENRAIAEYARKLETDLAEANERIAEIGECCISHANKLNRAGDKVRELSRVLRAERADRAALIAAMQDACIECDKGNAKRSAIIMRAALAKVRA